MSEQRKKAETWMSPIPKEPQAILSTDPKFVELTGTSHAVMLADWKANWAATKKLGGMTACNGFVGRYAVEMGLHAVTGWFELERSLFNLGMMHAWVPSTDGARPKCGDVMRHVKYHVDVCCDPAAGVEYEAPLMRAAAGQGSFLYNEKTDVWSGADRLMRLSSKGPYDYKTLVGWLDLEKFLGPKPSNLARFVPSWVGGWWKVLWYSQTFYYYFFSDGTVSWTRAPIAKGAAAPKPDDIRFEGKGEFADPVFDQVKIKWNSGAVEDFSIPQDVIKNQNPRVKMSGTWRESAESNPPYKITADRW